MTCYQLKNIKIDKVQHIINNLDAKSFNEKCELSTGWLMKKDDIRIRELMKKRLAEWIEEANDVKRKETKEQANENANESPNMNECEEEEKMMELEQMNDNEIQMPFIDMDGFEAN